MKNNEKFNQLCENSTRTIQRELSNYSSQFIFTDQNDMPKQYSIYQKIISSNVRAQIWFFFIFIFKFVNFAQNFKKNESNKHILKKENQVSDSITNEACVN